MASDLCVEGGGDGHCVGTIEHHLNVGIVTGNTHAANPKDIADIDRPRTRAAAIWRKKPPLGVLDHVGDKQRVPAYDLGFHAGAVSSNGTCYTNRPLDLGQERHARVVKGCHTDWLQVVLGRRNACRQG